MVAKVVDFLGEDALNITIAVLVVLVVFTGGAALMVWALLRAGSLPPPIALIVALSLLSLVALIGNVVTETESMLTIAATGVGALAGAVSAHFNTDRKADDDREPDGPSASD